MGALKSAWNSLVWAVSFMALLTATAIMLFSYVVNGLRFKDDPEE